MAIDRKKYIPKYADEGFEIVAQVEGLVFDIKDGVSVDDDVATLMRALHTLKGTSRMLEFKRVEKLTHAIESVFTAIKEQRVDLSGNAVKLTLSALDLAKKGIERARSDGDDDVEIHEHVKNLEALAANEEYAIPEAGEAKAPSQSAPAPPPANKVAPPPTDAPADAPVPAGKTAGPPPAPSEGKPAKGAKSESIRLPIGKIDGIVKSVASLQSLEISAKAISLDAAALGEMVKGISAKLKANKNRDPALVESVGKLERLSERVNAGLKNHSVDAGNSIRGAYDTVVSLRTLPLSTILDGYPRYVYGLSEELGKKVRLSIEGKENEIDKNIIEVLSETLMHMTRNAIDHGIETPGERVAVGKPETGSLSIVCSRESGCMKIVVSDDGRGIDHEKIRQKAAQTGFATEAAAAALSKEELTNFIFHSGFSTSGEVSGVSGRGVGMDVVRKGVEELKGSIVIDSASGKGAIFTIVVPLSIAALMGFPVKAGGMSFIFPATFVETILLAARDEIVTVIDRPEIKYGGRLVKLYYLSQVLRIKSAPPSDTSFVVIVRAYDDIAALAVDDVASMRSVILKPMPAFMESMPIFSGIVLNENYEMVSVLHVPTVIKMARHVKAIDFKKRSLEFEGLLKSILVVDDSRPTREIEKEILASEGYLVDTAADGAEALKAAKSKRYDLICTDINMPVMDGFMLIENIRKSEGLSGIPIIVISSMANEEDRKRAVELGASRYIVKNSFDNHNLIEAAKDLMGGRGK